MHDFTRDLQVAHEIVVGCRGFDAAAEGADSEPLQHLLWPMPIIAICKARPLGALKVFRTAAVAMGRPFAMGFVIGRPGLHLTDPADETSG